MADLKKETRIDLLYEEIIVYLEVNDIYKAIDNRGKISINVLDGALSAAGTCTLSKIG